LQHRTAVGFNATSLSDLLVDGGTISFHLDRLERLHTVTARFGGVDESATYRIALNGHPPQTVKGTSLVREGLKINQ
jgi:hypothetical protein